MKTGVHHKASSTGVGLALGLGVSLLITIALLAASAKLIQAELLQEERIGFTIMGTLLLASFGGAIASAWTIQRRKGLMCLCSGGLYWASLLAVTALFFGGQYDAVGVTALLILAGAGAAALLTMKEKKGRKNKKSMVKW